MAFQHNDDYRRAIDALSVFRVWEVAFSEGAVRVPPPTRAGLCPSPFRDDGSRESFSIVGNGGGFKDHGGDGVRGGIKRFAELCWPNLSPKEMAQKLIGISGIIPTPPTPREAAPARVAAPGSGSPASPAAAAAVVDPAIARAAQSIEKRQRLQELEDRIYAEREKLLRPPEVRWSPAWPAIVRERFLEGVDVMRREPRRVDELAKERGWPSAWVEELVNLELVGYPWARASTPGAKWARRQKAFQVQQPRLVGSGQYELTSTGYHQRFFEPARDGRPEIKGWLYLPSVPKFEPRSEFERELLAYGITQGAAPADWRPARPGDPRPVAPVILPAPFVLGDLDNARLIVLLEGQWDAITFYGACGWFHDTTPAEGVAVFGIRGAQGIDAFLGLWSGWLRKKKPRAWLIADNDAGGRTWREQPAGEPGLPRPPSLGDRLVAAGCREPVCTWLKPGPWGKDFNDYFKSKGGAAACTPSVMYAWMQRLGLLDRSGGVA